MQTSPRSSRHALGRPWIIECRDESHAAREAARAVLDAFVRSGEDHFGLALSGGRIAPAFFAALVAEARRRQSPLDRADFFQVDERCVPLTHPENNFRVARTHLLEPLGVAPHHIHRLTGELPPAEAVTQARGDWESWQRHARRGVSLDCLVLGVGEDGHVASLFPGNLPEDLADTAHFRAVTGPKPPPHRLTMGYPLLWEAVLVLVLAPGSAKRGILDASLGGTLDTPLSRVLRGRSGRDTWFFNAP